MKYVASFCLIINLAICILSGCANAQSSSAGKKESLVGKESLADKNILIVYLSRTKNTKAIAATYEKFFKSV